MCSGRTRTCGDRPLPKGSSITSISAAIRRRAGSQTIAPSGSPGGPSGSPIEMRYQRRASFLARRGGGVHHVGYRVDDVAATLARFEAMGIPMVDRSPRRGSRGTTVAFVHPKGFGGVLVEL